MVKKASLLAILKERAPHHPSPPQPSGSSARASSYLEGLRAEGHDIDPLWAQIFARILDQDEIPE